jgi:hypothetical protein
MYHHYCFDLIPQTNTMESTNVSSIFISQYSGQKQKAHDQSDQWDAQRHSDLLLYAIQINAATAFRPLTMTSNRRNDRWASMRRLQVEVETHDSTYTPNAETQQPFIASEAKETDRKRTWSRYHTTNGH